MLPVIYHLITQCYHSHRKARINFILSFYLPSFSKDDKLDACRVLTWWIYFLYVVIKSWGFDPSQFYFYWNLNFSIFGQWESLWVCSWVLPTWLQWSAVAFWIILDISCSRCKSAISPRSQHFCWCDIWKQESGC